MTNVVDRAVRAAKDNEKRKQLSIRLPPDLHASLAMIAEDQGISINTLVSEILIVALRDEQGGGAR